MMLDEKGKAIGIPLEMCASEGLMEIVQFLVEKGTELGSAVFFAAKEGHTNIVKFLINCYPNFRINSCCQKDNYEYTVLHLIAITSQIKNEENRLDCAIFLLAKGADPLQYAIKDPGDLRKPEEWRKKTYISLLELIVVKGHKELIQPVFDRMYSLLYLNEHEKLVNSKSKITDFFRDFNRVLNLAVTQKKLPVLEELIEVAVQKNLLGQLNTFELLLSGVSLNYLEGVQCLIRFLKYSEDQIVRLIGLIYKETNREILTFLIENINPEKLLTLELHIQYSLIQNKLMKVNIDLEKISKEILGEAIQKSNWVFLKEYICFAHPKGKIGEVVHILIKTIEIPGHRDEEGFELIQHILSLNLNSDAINLAFCSLWNTKSITHDDNGKRLLKMLLEKGVTNVDIHFSGEICYPLLWAVKINDEPLVDTLLNKNADVTVVDRYKKTALHYAADKNNLVVAKKLLSTKCIDIAHQDKDGETPLHSLLGSCFPERNPAEFLRVIFDTFDKKSPEDLEKLQKFVNLPDNSGKTALHRCIENRKQFVPEEAWIICIELLIKASADIYIKRIRVKGHDDRIPLESAQEMVQKILKVMKFGSEYQIKISESMEEKLRDLFKLGKSKQNTVGGTSSFYRDSDSENGMASLFEY